MIEKCYFCQEDYNSALCDKSGNQSNAYKQSNDGVRGDGAQVKTLGSKKAYRMVLSKLILLVTTAIVYYLEKREVNAKTCVLFDCGSHLSFMTEDSEKRL